MEAKIITSKVGNGKSYVPFQVARVEANTYHWQIPTPAGVGNSQNCWSGIASTTQNAALKGEFDALIAHGTEHGKSLTDPNSPLAYTVAQATTIGYPGHVHIQAAAQGVYGSSARPYGMVANLTGDEFIRQAVEATLKALEPAPVVAAKAPAAAAYGEYESDSDEDYDEDEDEQELDDLSDAEMQPAVKTTTKVSDLTDNEIVVLVPAALMGRLAQVMITFNK